MPFWISKHPLLCKRKARAVLQVWTEPRFSASSPFPILHYSPQLLKNEISSPRAQLFSLQWASILLAALQRWSLDKSNCCLRHDALAYGGTRRRCDSWILYYWGEGRFQFLTRMNFSWDNESFCSTSGIHLWYLSTELFHRFEHEQAQRDIK